MNTNQQNGHVKTTAANLPSTTNGIDRLNLKGVNTMNAYVIQPNPSVSEFQQESSTLDAFFNGEAPAPTRVTATPQPVNVAELGAVQRAAQLSLVISIGGSGGKAGGQLKARFVESMGKKPRNVEILSFDSADDPIAYRVSRDGAIVSLDKGSERLLFEKVPVGSIKQHRGRQPEMHERFGQALPYINRAYVIDGAAGERPQGAMALAWSASWFAQRVENALHRLTTRTKDLQDEMDGNVSLRVYLVGSIAGGQGAGAIIDAAYIIREKLLALGALGESSSVVGFLVLPGAFHGIERAQHRANAFATMEEVNALMLGKLPFITSYPNGFTIQSTQAPFDHTMVYDGIDENGRSFANQEEVTAQIAEALWLLTTSEVGAQEINTLVNESGVLLGVSSEGYGTFLGTSGQATLRWPAREVAERCAIRHSVAMIDRLLAGQSDAPPAPELAADGAGLREQLNSNEEGAPYAIRIIAPAALDQIPPDETPGQVRILFENYLQRRLYDDYFVKMNAKQRKLCDTAIERGAQRLMALLEAGRLQAALQWLRTEEQALARLQTEVTAAQTRLAEGSEQLQAQLTTAATALDRAAGGMLVHLPFVGRGSLQTAIATYLEQATALAQLRLAQRCEELIAATLRELAEWRLQQQRMLEQLFGRLRQTREWLLLREASLAQRAGARSEITLDDPAFVDYFYRSYAGDAATDAPLVVAQAGGLLNWVAATPETIGRQFIAGAMNGFQRVAQLDIESVLTMRWSDRSGPQWISRLQVLAAGAWNTDRAALKGGGVGLASFLTIGVPDAAHSIFANCGNPLVSTHDHERIVVLRTVYGASADALKPFAQWKHAYRQLAPERPLHVLPHYERSADQSQLIFALGLAYDLIQKSVTWYYYKPEDLLQDRVQLGQGLENALSTFAGMRSLQDEITRRVESQIAADGVAAATQRLDGWIKRNSAGDDLLKRMCQTVRDYMLRISNGAAIGKSDAGKSGIGKNERK